MIQDRDDRELAGEYVLGLLDGDELAHAKRRVASDRAFSRLVDGWRRHLADFDDTADRIEPGADLWNRIGVTISTAAPAAFSRDGGVSGGLWGSLRAWRVAAFSGAFASFVLAVLAGVLFMASRDDQTGKPAYIAILLNDETRQAGAVVNVFADGRAELVPLVDIAVPRGRALEIWTLWDRAVGPRSVGLIDAARATTLKLDALPRTVVDQLFEITLEPAGGSPIGRPTGPILFKGTTARAL